jgi:hypothetical protein
MTTAEEIGDDLSKAFPDTFGGSKSAGSRCSPEANDETLGRWPYGER